MTAIRKYIDQGYTLVTANNRIAHSIGHQYGQELIQQQIYVWETPDIISLSGWLERTWQAVTSDPDGAVLLNATQEYFLWQQVINDSPYSNKLLHSTGIARNAVEAWRIMREHEIPLAPPGCFLNEDAYLFKSLANSFIEICKQQNWIVQSDLVSEIIKYNLADHIKNPIVLVGFVNQPPQLKTLTQCLNDTGVNVINAELVAINESINVHYLPDKNSQIHAVANWAAATYTSSPEDKIGVIVPNLRKERLVVEQAFSDAFSLKSNLNFSNSPNSPFSISLGKPLIDYPIIQAVMSVMKVCEETFSDNEFSHFLLNDYIKGAQEERHARAKFDLVIRGHYSHSYRLQDIQSLLKAKDIEKSGLQQLYLAIDDISVLLKDKRRTRTPQQWAAFINKILDAVGWPATQELKSEEYQAIESWNSALEQLMALEIVVQELSFLEMLAQLRRILSETRFQPETLETPVQILGVSGAEVLEFDHLWVINMDEESYPQKLYPNPFIPYSLQREYKLPHMNPDVRLAMTEKEFAALTGSSRKVILSYFINDGETVQRPSSLLEKYEKTAFTYSDKYRDYLVDIFQSRDLDIYSDDFGPGITETQSIKGGTGIIRDQSACPFRAFARHRLGLHDIEQIDIGLSAMDRGSIVHDVMQAFWQKCESYQKLKSLNAEHLIELIDLSIKDVIQRYATRYPSIFTDRFTDTEVRRLARLVAAWLDIEKMRADFTVSDTEELATVEFEGVSFTTRMDRVDKLEDGSYAIIDYKTGLANSGAWFGHRPEEPQLPFYVITSDKEISSVAFAIMKLGQQMGFKGITREPDIFPHVKAAEDDGWQDTRILWMETLSSLVQAFKSGDAQVNPRDNKACRQCDLHSFCRILDASDSLPGVDA